MSSLGLVPQPSTSPLHPRCLRLADCTAIRHGAPWCRPLHDRSHRIVATRSFNASVPRAKDYIRPNSLQKTLEVQRAANRSALLRKVAYDDLSAYVFRPDLPPENFADHEKLSASEHRPREPVGSSKESRHWGSEDSAQPQGRSSIREKVSRIRSVGGSRESSAREVSLGPEKRSGELHWDVNEKEHRPQQSPWLDHVRPLGRITDGLARLDAEIRALERYLTPTREEQASVDQVIESVSTMLARVVPHPPRVIGSWGTGMALSHSDLDFILPVNDPVDDPVRKPSPMRPEMVQAYRKTLRGVDGLLRESPLFKDQVDALDGRTPAVTAVHDATGLRLQFYCGEGPPSSIEYVKDYQAEYPALRPLYIATRMMLEVRGVFGPRNSSISSYGLLMLIVASLKMNHGRFLRPDNLGEHLLEILHTYGKVVDWRKTGVSVDPPGFFHLSTIKSAESSIKSQDPDFGEEEEPAYLRGQRALLNSKRTAAVKRNFPAAGAVCVQDPTNYMNDVGKSCVRPAQLQDTFTTAHERLRGAIAAWDESAAGTSDSLLAHALKANFDDFEQLRSQIMYPSWTDAELKSQRRGVGP
ncbi:hypothetical protein VTN00DRAFT_7411 [Thermoascus crustaceus]|uniref:uncharacterized protein n=1 Tax=Thermoascus crustaceus TaxID=5088 RepID=UPI003742A858